MMAVSSSSMILFEGLKMFPMFEIDSLYEVHESKLKMIIRNQYIICTLLICMCMIELT